MSNERRWITVHDYLTFKPKELLENKRFLFETKDSKSETGHSLLVRVDATHAGIITGNRKFYRPDFMAESAHTWVPSNKPLNPVLRQHDDEGDVLGRVIESKYIDDSWKYVKDFPILRDMAFYNRDSKARKVNMFKSIDWITDNLRGLKDYQGLGHIELGLKITNPDAIAKVLRDEYLCVSAGAITDEAICSICHTDWASNPDKCEHKPGEIVDGRPAFLISGRFKYKELSFVNFGADPFAAVTGKELKDHLETMFFLGLPIKDQASLVSRGLKLTDSLYESDLQIHIEDQAMTIDVAALTQTLKNPELTAAEAFSVRDTLLSWQPESEDEKREKRSLQSTLTAKIRKNEWKPEEVIDQNIETPAADEMAAITAAVDVQEVAAAVAESESVQDGGTSAAGNNTSAVEASTATQNQDATAATPALLIDAELRALGVQVNLLDADEKAEPTPEAKACLEHYDGLDKLHTGAGQELRWKMADLHNALGERWGKDRWVEYAKGYLANHVKDALFVSKEDLDLKEETIVSQDAEIKTLQTSVVNKDAAVAKFFTDSKRSLATSLVMYNALHGKEGFTGLKDQQVEDKITELSKRHISSLRDSLADAFTELQWAAKPATADPAVASNDSNTTVNDNASVTESDSFQPGKLRELTVQDTAKLRHALSFISSPTERSRFEADVRYGRRLLA